MGIQDAIRNHPAIGGLATGVVIGASSVGIINLIRGKGKTTTRKASTKKRTSSPKRKTTRKSTRKSKSSGKKTSNRSSTKKIYTTKNGQPYIKNAKGQAKFISKKSAKLRRKRKGGYY